VTLDAANLISRIAGPVAVASGTSTLFTGLANHVYTIRKIKIVNTDTVNAKTFQLFIGGSAQANAITPPLSVDPGGWAESDDFTVLAGAETLQITTSGTGLSASVNGLDQS